MKILSSVVSCSVAKYYLGSLTLEIFEIVISDRGDGAAAPASAPAGAHRIKVAVLQIATLVVRAVVSVAVSLTILPLIEILMKPLLEVVSRVIVFLQVEGPRIEYRSVSEKIIITFFNT